ncbi:TetR/AcrR family transcriptional regulator [Christensenella tenuis]|uniref:TetR/AcrR family transcriptional regulator n=1 Tax=Christensenella tenuis TaxID=2763033 RepID=A0ABR7EEZ9_9FIRM|nr:TetR/AcrR family transcriptional regulator [Christensenella tenuis]MBC5648335.1 TetR/AcrR family transcriptional regulator [Christensenella tenuis]
MVAKQTKPLKDRLIDATVREIEKNGAENLSLRKIAADCGVTHATAYKYFENKQDLISVCRSRIAVRVHAYCKRAAHNAQEPYIAMCKAYLRYMVRYPHFHALLHMSPLAKQNEDPVIRAFPERQHAAQREMIRDFLRRCGIPEKERLPLIQMVSTLLNGLIAVLNSRTAVYEGSDITELVDVFVFNALKLRPKERPGA